MFNDRFEIILDRLTAALVNVMQENAELRETNKCLTVRLNDMSIKLKGESDDNGKRKEAI